MMRRWLESPSIVFRSFRWHFMTASPVPAYQAHSRSISSSPDSVSGLLVAILMKNQTLGGTCLGKLELKCGVDTAV